MTGSLTQNNAQAEAFALLRRVVDELHQLKAQNPTASEVRLRMATETNHAFSQESLGFQKFREFLRAAERVGIVTLVDRPGDIYVVPADSAQRETTQRLRSDVWRAVIDWSKGPYVWNTLTRQAAPQTSTSLDSKNTGDELISMPKLEARAQLDLLRRFLEGLDFDSELRSSLLEGLKDETSISQTVRRIKNLRPDLARDWSFELRRSVDHLVEEWCAGDGRLARSELYEDPTVQRHSGQSETSKVSLRALVHRAIDRMSDDELRSLSFPVGFLFES